MPPGTYRGAIAAARQGGLVPTVCRCKHENCTCDQMRAPPVVAQQELARRKAQMRALLLDTPDEAVIRIALQLGTPREMLRLAVACKRFRTRSFAWWRSVTSLPQTPLVSVAQRISIVEEAARRWIEQSDELRLPSVRIPVDRTRMPVPASWLGKMHEAQKQYALALITPIVFTRQHVYIVLSEGGHVATRQRTVSPEGAVDASHRTAATNVVMRSGRHFAEFTVLHGVCMFLGVVSPEWHVEVDECAERVAGHCFYDTFARIRWPQGDEPQWDEDWSSDRYNAYRSVANTRQTRERSAQKGDRVGMLLDLDAGTLAIYKNDQRLGILSSNLVGREYCWAATLFAADSAVRIEQKPVPDIDDGAQVVRRPGRPRTWCPHNFAKVCEMHRLSMPQKNKRSLAVQTITEHEADVVWEQYVPNGHSTHIVRPSDPIVFTRQHVYIVLSEGGHVATRQRLVSPEGAVDASHRTAATNVVMRSGRHFAEFTVLHGVCMFLGVVSPEWHVEVDECAERVAGHCFYDTFAQIRWPQGDEPQWDEDWSSDRYNAYRSVADTRQTQERSAQKGDRVGMLLDLDAGTLAIYKNDQRLGILSSNLVGREYCWAATLFAADSAVRIEQKPVPDIDDGAQVVLLKAHVSRPPKRQALSAQGHRANQNDVWQQQHTLADNHARIALDSAAYSTPAEADSAAGALLSTRIQHKGDDSPEPTDEPTEPPEPTDKPVDELTAPPEPTDEPTEPPEPTDEPVDELRAPPDPTDEPTEEQVLGIPAPLTSPDVEGIPVIADVNFGEEEEEEHLRCRLSV